MVFFLLPLQRHKAETMRGMEKIIVNVSWCDKNYGAALSDNVPGAVVVTAKSYDELIEEVKATLQFHVEGMIADGDDVPQWLRDGDYDLASTNTNSATTPMV